MILYSQPYLVAAILQAFLYVIYLVSSVHAFRWLLYEEGWTLKSYGNINWGLLITTFAVFVFTTADLAFEIGIHLTIMGGEVISRQLVIASISVECATFVITDALLNIRCWLVYRMSWRAICFPLILLWIANVVFMVNYIVNYTLWTFVSEVPYHRRAKIYLQLFSSCNFGMNLYATSAIVYRLWYIARTSSNRRLSILYRISRVVATTGILYTWTCLPLLVTALLLPNDLGFYLIFDALNFSMAGITFNLFLIRVGQLRSERSEMGVDRDTHNVSGSVVLSTVPFGFPTLTMNDTQADANLGEKHTASIRYHIPKETSSRRLERLFSCSFGPSSTTVSPSSFNQKHSTVHCDRQ